MFKARGVAQTFLLLVIITAASALAYGRYLTGYAANHSSKKQELLDGVVLLSSSASQYFASTCLAGGIDLNTLKDAGLLNAHASFPNLEDLSLSIVDSGPIPYAQISFSYEPTKAADYASVLAAGGEVSGNKIVYKKGIYPQKGALQRRINAERALFALPAC